MPNTETLYTPDHEKNDTALIVAARRGDLELVKAILASPHPHC